MPFSALAIANYFIERGIGTVNPMKAQKLVYFAHGWSLALHDQPLLTERIEAWKYGPVVPQLYQDLKEFGAAPIPAPVTAWRLTSRSNLIAVTPKIDEDPSVDVSDTRALLDRIWEVYGGYSAVRLSNATHAPGSPWDITWKQCGGKRHAVIDDNLIKGDFLKRLNKTNPPK